MKWHRFFLSAWFALCCTFASTAQQTTFTSVFYGLQDAVQAYGAIQLPDSTYLAVGEMNDQALVFSMDPYGVNLWEKVYGFSGGGGFFSRIIATHDGNLMALGTLTTDWFGGDIVCMKLTAGGDTLWTKAIDFGDIEMGTSIQETGDHGFILSGISQVNEYNDIKGLVVKLDSTGNLEWGITLAGEAKTEIHAVREDPGGGFYAIGEMVNPPAWDSKAILARITAGGTLLWQKQATAAQSARGFDVLVSDTGLLCLVEAYYYTLFVRTDSSGIVEWARSFPSGSGWVMNNHLPTAMLHPTSDRGYMITTTGQLGSALKVDSSFLAEWRAEVLLETADVIESMDGGFLFIGNGPLMGVIMYPTYNPQVGMIKTDSLGNTTGCLYTWGEILGSYPITFTPAQLTPQSGGMATALHPVITDTGLSLYTGCVAMYGGVDEGTEEDLTLIISPNPSNGNVTISSDIGGTVLESVELYNSLGILVFHAASPQELPTCLDLTFLPHGMYLIKAESKGKNYAQKLLIMR